MIEPVDFTRTSSAPTLRAVLHLASTTPARWAERALAEVDVLLLDHAHCEKKAASTALSLIFRYPEHPELALPLSRLAREELRHFEQVVGILRTRGHDFARLVPSPYAAQLMKAVRTHEPARLLDTLLCCALIEARSCERMQVLARAFAARLELDDHPATRVLHDLYDGLLASEARHFASYLDLARAATGIDESELQSRLSELAEHEAAVLLVSPGDSPRMHEGVGPG